MRKKEAQELFAQTITSINKTIKDHIEFIYTYRAVISKPKQYYEEQLKKILWAYIYDRIRVYPESNKLKNYIFDLSEDELTVLNLSKEIIIKIMFALKDVLMETETQFIIDYITTDFGKEATKQRMNQQNQIEETVIQINAFLNKCERSK